MNLKDCLSALQVRKFHLDTPVEASRTEQGGIKHVNTVGCGKKNHALLCLQTVHFDEQGVQGLFTFIVSAADSGEAGASDRIDFINEDQTGNEAALLAARYDRKAATQQDLEEARDKVCWGRERRSRKIPERERRLTAWHEAGHAIASLYCKYATPLHKVTIIPRGMALGMTMMLPEEDRYSRTRLEMLDDMVIDMGGRVAEEITFGDITGGASADISHATNVAHAMVCRFGMSEKLGTVQYGERSDHIYLGRDITRSESFSEETAREIDLEVKRLVMESKKRCEQILNEHKDKLDKLAEALLEKETMNVAEIRKLLELPAPQEEVKAEDDTHNEIVPEQNADTQAQV